MRSEARRQPALCRSLEIEMKKTTKRLNLSPSIIRILTVVDGVTGGLPTSKVTCDPTQQSSASQCPTDVR